MPRLLLPHVICAAVDGWNASQNFLGWQSWSGRSDKEGWLGLCPRSLPLAFHVYEFLFSFLDWSTMATLAKQSIIQQILIRFAAAEWTCTAAFTFATSKSLWAQKRKVAKWMMPLWTRKQRVVIHASDHSQLVLYFSQGLYFAVWIE